MTSCSIILVAGPSGSGKSRLSGQTNVPQVRLDDFYFDHDHPGLPTTELPGGVTVIDWDDRRTWNTEAAVEALVAIATTGRATIPRYDISLSEAVGSYEFELGDAPAVICEGIFAMELVRPCRDAGLDVTAIWLDRPRSFNFTRRLQRDLRQRRKSPSVLVRRGVALFHQEPQLRRRALEHGFTPLGMRAAARRIRQIVER